MKENCPHKNVCDTCFPPYNFKIESYENKQKTKYPVVQAYFPRFALTLYLFPFASLICLLVFLRSIPSIDTYVYQAIDS